MDNNNTNDNTDLNQLFEQIVVDTRDTFAQDIISDKDICRAVSHLQHRTTKLIQNIDQPEWQQRLQAKMELALDQHIVTLEQNPNTDNEMADILIADKLTPLLQNFKQLKKLNRDICQKTIQLKLQKLIEEEIREEETSTLGKLMNKTK